MGKGREEDGNAYATTDDWAMQEEDGVEALSDSIRAHALNLKGGEEGINLDDDIAPVPLGVAGSEAERSNRSFNTLSDPGLSSARNFASRGSPSSYGLPRNAAPSALRPSRRGLAGGSLKTSIGGKYRLKGSMSQTKAATRLRALIALACLTFSLLLALLVGYGATGQWITRTFILTSNNVKEVSNTGGIPGALGQARAYNGTFDIPNLEAMHIILPVAIENGYADWRIPFPASKRSDLPVFWSINKSGGSVVEKILGHCLGLVEVSGEGATHEETYLQILETPAGTRYINVDVTTKAGLERAMRLKLVESSLADVMFTPLVTQSAEIFSSVNPGRLFTILRHPLERSMGIYEAARASDQAIASMSLADYAANELPNNELVRSLVGKSGTDDLTEDDLFLAMEIVRRKCVVGLVDRMEESIMRFQTYFGWAPLLVDGVSECQKQLLAQSDQRVLEPKPGSDAYNIMVGQNRLDLRLYDYALHVYDIQGGQAQAG